MTYGHLGQPRRGTLSAKSPNPKKAGARNVPTINTLGFGGAKSKNVTDRGRRQEPTQQVRGFRQSKASIPGVKNVSANRVRRTGGKGR